MVLEFIPIPIPISGLDSNKTCIKLQIRISTEDISCGNVLYEHLFSEVAKQKEAIVLFLRLINAREQMESDNPPGEILDPSTGASLGCDSDVLTSSVLTALSFGK